MDLRTKCFNITTHPKRKISIKTLSSEDIQISNIGSYQGDSEVDVDCQVDNLKYKNISQSPRSTNKHFCFKDIFSSILPPSNFKLKMVLTIKGALSSTCNFLISDLGVHKWHGDLSVCGHLGEPSAKIAQLSDEMGVAWGG